MALDNLNRLIAEMMPVIEDALEPFAEEWEDWARDHRTWLDDSGSAAAALTGWVVDTQSHRKNFGATDWVKAQQPRYESPRHGNKPPNFVPAVPDLGEIRGPQGDAIAVALAHMIQYGGSLEHDAQGHLLSDALQSHRDEFVRVVADAIASI